jgi:hypothetical protein
VDLEPNSIDPVIQRTCAECGAELTEREIESSMEAGDIYLCSVHAAEQVPLDQENEVEE